MAGVSAVLGSEYQAECGCDVGLRGGWGDMGVRRFVLWPWEGGARLMGRSASDEAIEFVTGVGGDGGAVDLGGADRR